MNLPVYAPDLFILKSINPDRPIPWLDSLMIIITSKGYLFFILLYIFVILIERRTATDRKLFLSSVKRLLIPLILTIIGWMVADALGNVFKKIIERPRPFNVIDDIRVLVGRGSSYSFPSNHAMTSFVVAPLLGYFFSYLRIPAYILAILIGLSRIYVGVHYPSDILGGVVIGFGVAFTIIYGWKRFERFYKKDRISAIFFLLLIALFIARLYYIAYGSVELSPDEAHYWEWSRRLDLSYYSKGPLIAYLIKLSTMIGGVTEIGVRLFAPIFLFLSSITLYLLTLMIYKDSKIAILSGMLPQVVPLFSIYGVVFTIDSPFLFFWALSLLLFFKAINEKKTFWWILLGAFTGLGILTKYSMVFFYLCGVIFLGIKKRIDLLKSIGPYISIGVSFLVFMPVIVWNIQNDFVTLRHTLGHVGVYEGLGIRPKHFFEFIGSQFGVITPVFLIAIIISLIWNLRTPDSSRTFLLSFSLPVFLFFLLKSLHAKVQANWPLIAYHTIFIYFSWWYVNRWNELKKGLKVFFISSIFSLLFITPLIHFPQILGLPPELDPSSRLRGWKELGKRITEISHEMEKEGQFFIISDRYQVSSEIAFYAKGNPVTYCVNLGRRMNQYDLWPGFYNFIHQNAIFVTIGDTDMNKKFRERFSECKKEVFITDIRKYSIFKCYDFKGIQKQIFDRY